MNIKKLNTRYTKQDLIKLSIITDEYYANKDDSYKNLMVKEILPTCGKSNVKSILQFLGSYVLSMPETVALKKLGPFIFEESLKNMPLYINNHKEELPWKTIVARWRLKIGK